MPITSIDNNQGVLNFIEELNLKLSKPQFNHLLNLMTGIANIDGKRNISNISSEGKTLWSHCIVSSQVITEDYSFPLGFEQYLNKKYCAENKLDFNSKIDIACNLLELFHQSNNKTNYPIYLLTDSWFTSKRIIEKSLSYGYHLIGGLKTNRCI